jgi:hypothetical protein
MAPPRCASCAIPELPFFNEKYSNSKYSGPKIYAGIGIGMNIKERDKVGFHRITANKTAETAPDAPRLR